MSNFTYSQSTGAFLYGDEHIGTGYSGHAEGLNNPALQSVHDIGPIPAGRYTIEPPIADEKVGPVAMHLVPYHANEMFGRGDCMIHGDNPKMDRSASHGCIVLNREARMRIGELVLAGINQLYVSS